MIYDESLEEIWRIKREIASEYATLDIISRECWLIRNRKEKTELSLSRSRFKNANLR